MRRPVLPLPPGAKDPPATPHLARGCRRRPIGRFLGRPGRTLSRAGGRTGPGGAVESSGRPHTLTGQKRPGRTLHRPRLPGMAGSGLTAPLPAGKGRNPDRAPPLGPHRPKRGSFPARKGGSPGRAEPHSAVGNRHYRITRPGQQTSMEFRGLANK